MPLGVVVEHVVLELAALIEQRYVELALGHVNADPAASVAVHRIGPSSYAGLAVKACTPGRWPKLPFGLVERRNGREYLSNPRAWSRLWP